jgi:hypothetical protein
LLRSLSCTWRIFLTAASQLWATLHLLLPCSARYEPEIVRGPDAMLSLASIPLTVRISELYRGLFVLEAPTSSGNELSEVV